MNKLLLYISFFAASFAFGQGEVLEIIDYEPPIYKFENLNYRSQIDHDQWNFTRGEIIHSGIKPLINIKYQSEEKSRFKISKGWGKRVENFPINNFEIYPLINLEGGFEFGSTNLPAVTGGLGFGLDYSSKKWVFTTKLLPYYSMNGYFQDSIQTNFNMDMSTNRALASNLFYQGEILAAYRANKFFTLLGGYGKNFFGEGYRSLLLSDNIGAHPFFKIETAFAGIKYVNLYNFWRDNSVDPFDKSLDIPKFTSTHYLSWNITKDLNFSVFETVVFQVKDTLVNRGFDINYINPIVFYRPVEYGLGSSDNVLIGASMSYKINDNHNVYSQFILDEFLLSEITSHSRWWANKYGWQVGYKSNEFFTKNLYFQLEFNGVRPFTYSHKSSQHAYGHMNAAAAHPAGANFMELVNITSYKFGKHRITNKLTFITYGADDSSNVSNGQNIFKSYTLRPGNFDQLLFQGIRTNVLNENIIYEYAILPKIDMYLTATYNWRLVNTSQGTQNFHYFSIGLKSRIWNTYSDF